MPRYRPLDNDWVVIAPRSHRDNDWKIGMLGYRMARREGLLDLHIIATRPSHQGCYSDAHVTFVDDDNAKQHIYYQMNGGKLVADYALAPHDWRSSYWVSFPGLRDPTEAEVRNFITYWRAEGALENPPRAV